MLFRKLAIIIVFLSSANADKLRGSTLSIENTIEDELECIQGCPEEISPVCGINGFTYTNGCVAKCQGVDVQNLGDCKLNHVQRIQEGGDFEVTNSSDDGHGRKLSNELEYDTELEENLAGLQFSNTSTLGLEYGFFQQVGLSHDNILPEPCVEGSMAHPGHRNLAFDWVAAAKTLWSVAKAAYSLLTKQDSFNIADALQKMEANLKEEMKLMRDDDTLARVDALADTYLRIQEKPSETGNINTFLSNSAYVLATLERVILPLDGARKLDFERAQRLVPALIMLVPMRVSVARYEGYSDGYIETSTLSRAQRIFKHLLGYDSCVALLDNRVVNMKYNLINVVELPTNPPQKGVLMRYFIDKECPMKCSTYPHEPTTRFTPCSGRICGKTYYCYDCVLSAWKDAIKSNKVYKIVRASFRELVSINPKTCRMAVTGAKIDSCRWQSISNSHHKRNWCDGGNFINRFKFKPVWNARPSDSPLMTPAECCHIKNTRSYDSYASCKWHEVGYSKSHFGGWWCPTGSFLRAIDQDGGPPSKGYNYPVVGRANCCKPWLNAAYGQCFWSDLRHKDFAFDGFERPSNDPLKRWCPNGTVLVRVDLDSRFAKTWSTHFGQAMGTVGWQSAEHVSPLVANALCCSIKPEYIHYHNDVAGPP